MCDRCTVIECAFGLRDPLPPRIASLDGESITPSVNECISASVPVKASTATSGLLDRTHGSGHPVDVNGRRFPDGVTQNEAAPPLTPSSTRFSAVSNRDCYNHAKWSDVASLGSRAVQSHALSAINKEATSQSILLSIMDQADILDALMLNCPDFQTLFALVTSCKTAKRSFEQHPQGVIKALLRTMPQELQYLTVALIGIIGCHIGTSHSIKRAMETWLGMGPKPLGERLRIRPFEIIRKLARSFSAIDVFMRVIPKNCVTNFTDYKTVLASRVGLNYFDVTEWANRHPLIQQTEWSDVPDDTEWDVPDLPRAENTPQAISLPLNDRETYRLRRALVRYELFCAIFYLGPDKYYDTQDHPHRFRTVPESCRKRAFCKDQAIFLKKYVNPWEIGELAVVSHFIFDLVRNAYFHKYKTLRYDEAYDSWYGHFGNKNHGRNRHDDHEEVVDEFDNHMVWFASQGLTLLHKIYIDRKAGYQALVGKHGEPCYRATELFVPFEKCADRQGYDVKDPNASWEPRHIWSDTLGMEQPSRGWLAKSPASDSMGYNDAYWGEKWMRKIGYYIWDRD